MNKLNIRAALSFCRYIAMAAFLASCMKDIKQDIETTITLPTPPYPEVVNYKDDAEPVNVRILYGASIGVSHYNSNISSEFVPMPSHAASSAAIIDILDPFYMYSKEQYRKGIRLTTELRLKIDGESTRGIINNLSTSIGEDGITQYDNMIFRGITPNKDRTWPYFGNNKPISKENIFTAINKGVEDITIASKNGTTTGLFYINAHGTVINQMAYLIPGDAKPKDTRSWISIGELLNPIYKIAQNQSESNPKIRILVIIDVCLKGVGGELKVPQPPAGVALIFSTSPGQYAWHYVESTKVDENITSNVADKKSQKSIQQTSMSFIPIALKKSIYDFGKNLEPMDKIEAHKRDERYRSNIKMGDLLSTISLNMKKLIDADKTITENGGQKMASYMGPGVENMEFLTINRATFQKPREKQYGLWYTR